MSVHPLATARNLAGRAANAAHAIAARRLGGAVILLYHRVAALETDPQQLALPPERFAAHLDHVARTCEPMGLREVAARLRRGGLPRRAVAVTFDDGYRDNLLAAKPALERADIPATVFVSSGYVGAHREFWWDELERHLLTGNGDRAPEVELAGATVAVGTPEERRAAYDALHPRIRQWQPEGIDGVLRALRLWAHEPAAGLPRETHLPVTHDELRDLDGGLVEIGAHTRRHPSLAAQSAAAQREEIGGSTADLSAWLGRSVRTFSYPFGGPHVDVSRITRRIARKAGHELAVVNFPVRATALDGRYAIPRFLVRDWPGEQFAAWLDERFED